MPKTVREVPGDSVAAMRMAGSNPLPASPDTNAPVQVWRVQPGRICAL
jgi:hypothetical protein